MSISGVDVQLILRLSPGPYTLDQDKMVEVSRQPQNLLMIMHLRYVPKNYITKFIGSIHILRKIVWGLLKTNYNTHRFYYLK